jgi:polyferredoxin
MVVAIPLFFGIDGGNTTPQGYFYCKWCPAGMLEASVPVNFQLVAQGEKGLLDTVLGFLASIKFWIAVLFLGSFVFWYRPFCKIACPIGAFLGLFNRVSFLDFGKSRNACRTCKQCSDVCPVIPDVVVMDNPADCIRCYRCADPPCSRDYRLEVDEEACTGCLRCVKTCPNDVLEGERKKPPRMKDASACTGCRRCVESCPNDAIEHSSC